MNEDVKSENLRIHSRAEELIACLEGEIAKRDARIVELEADLTGTQSRVLVLQDQWRQIDAELAAIKAQEPVEYQQWSRYENWDRVDKAVFELGLLSSTPERFRALYAAPVSEAKAQGVVMPDVNAAAKALCNRHAMICGVDVDDQWKEYSQDFIADAETVLANARLTAAPVQQVSVPDGATLILGDTGRKDLDRLIDRLMSSDPDFEDCTAAAALLRRLFMEEISGPKGHATWKDAAVAERLRRVSMRPSETVVAMAREGLAVYSGPNMNEHKVCAEIVRLADISDTAMLAAAPAAPAADGWIPVGERLPDSGSTVIAYYLNSYGKGRTIRAQHVESWTIEAEDVADADAECVDYSEQDDCYYLLQGWYECIDNWDEYYRVAVTEGPITHWMPLPAAPSSAPQQLSGVRCDE